jgi:hypothetical protein
MKIYGGVEVQLQHSCPQHYMVSDQLRTLAALPPGEWAGGTHWLGGWMGPRTGLGSMKKRKKHFTSINVEIDYQWNQYNNESCLVGTEYGQ